MPFEPFIAFRDVNTDSLRFLDRPKLQPDNALTRGSSLLLLIHGFNNSVEGASGSYSGWRSLQEQLGGIAGVNLAGVYWPGSNWENFAVYMQAIGQAEETAQRLARVLHEAAAAFGILRVRVVTHSLGARLTLELLHQLRKDADPRIRLERFVVMAAAVPTRFLTPGRPMRQSLELLHTPFFSLYSPDDAVLRIAFRLGESLRGEGFFPVALGHDRWGGGSAIAAPQLTQTRNVGAGHSDYWFGSEGESRARALQAGRLAREFLGLGLVERDTPVRDLAPRSADASRDIGTRETPSRG